MTEKQHLILLHGALGSKKQFDTLTDFLSDKYTLHSLNFEGHGGRKMTKPFDMETFAEDVVNFMDAYEIEKSNFFGYSMGGYIALNVAKEFPSYVKRILTLGTKFEWTPESAEKETQMLNPEKIEEKVPKFAEMLKKRHHPLDWKEVLKHTAQMMSDLGNGKALKPEDVQHIKKRIMIAVGELDNMVSLEESRIFADALPYGEIMMIQGFPHPIEKIDPNLLSQLITSFFE